MKKLMPLAAAAFVGAFGVRAAPLHAEEAFTRVTLDAARGISLELPSSALSGLSTAPHGQGDLMFLMLTNGHSGLACSLAASPYTPTWRAKEAAAGLAGAARNRLCLAHADEAGITGLVLEETSSATVSGRPAGRCAASYSDANDGRPGKVETVLAIADPAAFYLLTCVVSAQNLEEAVFEYAEFWALRIQRMEESLTLGRY